MFMDCSWIVHEQQEDTTENVLTTNLQQKFQPNLFATHLTQGSDANVSCFLNVFLCYNNSNGAKVKAIAIAIAIANAQ